MYFTYIVMWYFPDDKSVKPNGIVDNLQCSVSNALNCMLFEFSFIHVSQGR